MPSNIFSARRVEKGVFLDERYLYPEFVPERLPHREKEIDGLAACLRPILSGRKPSNVFLYGPVGVGKTACAKFVLKQLEDASSRAKSICLNCFEYNSRASVLIALANFAGAAVPRRGFATDEIFSEFIGALGKCDFMPIVVLDEADQLMVEPENSKLLYDLLRVVEHGAKPIGLIMISNDAAFTSKLDSRISSSLSLQHLQFEPYSPQQLKAILGERAELAFAKGRLESDVVAVAAGHAARLGGDCRVAIESLLRAGRIAERSNSQKVRVAHLREAFAEAGSVSALKAVKHLSKEELALLRIIAEAQPVNSGRLYGIYAKGGGILKERRLREMLAGLEKQGLLVAKYVKGGSHGNTREFSVQVLPKSVLAEISALSK